MAKLLLLITSALLSACAVSAQAGQYGQVKKNNLFYIYQRSCALVLISILSVVVKVGRVRLPVLMVGPARISMTGTLNAFLEALPLEVEDRRFYRTNLALSLMTLSSRSTTKTTTASGGSETLAPGYSFIRAVVG